MSEINNAGETLHPVRVAEELSIEAENRSISSSTSDIIIEKIAPVTKDDLYSADEEHGEKKRPILDDSPLESKKKKVEFEGANVEPAPPPYTPATAEAVKIPFWKKRWFLLAPIGGLVLLIIVVAVSLAV
jgi:hypothetical protein